MHYHNRVVNTTGELFALPTLSVIGIAAPNVNTGEGGEGIRGIKVPGVTKDRVFVIMQKEGDALFPIGDPTPITRAQIEAVPDKSTLFPVYVLYNSQEDEIA